MAGSHEVCFICVRYPRCVAGERLVLSDSYLLAMAALLIIAGTEFYLRSKRAIVDAAVEHVKV